jgi:glycine/D-amino acid oxidase-like deaminating enzyme
MSVAYWQDESNTTSTHVCDVVVIGAGITGASVAWWFRDSGLSVAVVDRGDVCAGASGRNAGFVTCGSVEHFSRQVASHGLDKALALWRLGQENIALLEEKIVGSGVDCDFARNGTWSLAGSAHELSELRESSRLMREHGIRVEMADADEVRRDLGARHFEGGALYLDDGEVHPAKLVRGILERSGASVFPHHEVREILQQGDAVRVLTQRRTFSAAIAILATNGYSAQLDPWFADKIYPTRGQIIVTDPVAKFLPQPCYANFVLDYFRQLPDGRVLIGGFRQLARETEVGTSDEPNPLIHEALERFLRHHFEALADVRIDYRWAGTMGFSADGLPMIGALPTKPSVYLLGGYTAHGLGFGFVAAKLLSELVLEGKSPPHLSARRFT